VAITSGTVLKVVATLLMPDATIAQNVFYAVITDLVTSNDEVDVVSDCKDWVEAMYYQIIARVSDQVTGSDVKVYEWDSTDSDWDEIGSDTLDLFNAGAIDMLPHGVAAVVHAKTLDPDTQGTKFIAGLTEGQTVDSDLSAACLADLALFCDYWTDVRVGDATGGDIVPGVWSTKGPVFRAMNGNYSVNGVVGYQRRRKPGVGA
jgi:hypothetical protein